MTVEHASEAGLRLTADRPSSLPPSSRSLSRYSLSSTTLSSGKFRKLVPAATPLIPRKLETVAIGRNTPFPVAEVESSPRMQQIHAGGAQGHSVGPLLGSEQRQQRASSAVSARRGQGGSLLSRPPSACSTRSISATTRPGSAMNSADRDPLVAQASDPYMTVYKSEFHKRSAPEAPDVRPPTQMGFSDQRFRDDTTYATEYSKKRPNLNSPLWSGGNNPHPSQAFMVWKYPTSKQRQPDDEAPSITNEQYDQVMRGKCQSTYQTDFLGFPQGYRPPEAGGSSLRNPAEEVPYTLDSLQRYSYQQPNQSEALRIGTTRYSHSGADRHRLLVGGAPSISQVQLSAKHSTTYDRHFNESAPPTSRAPKFPEKSGRSVKGKDADAVAKLYAESRSDVESMDKRYAEPNGYGAPDFVQRSPGKIPEPRWVTTPVPAPLPS